MGVQQRKKTAMIRISMWITLITMMMMIVVVRRRMVMMVMDQDQLVDHLQSGRKYIKKT